MFISALVIMFRPSPPASLPLVMSFILKCITALSSAHNFTTTMASSEDPLSVTDSLLIRLGGELSMLQRPGADGPSPGKNDNSVFAHLPPLPGSVTERILGFDSREYLAPLPSLQRFTFV